MVDVREEAGLAIVAAPDGLPGNVRCGRSLGKRVDVIIRCSHDDPDTLFKARGDFP